MTQRVAVLGTGKIGEALVSGLLRAGKSPDDVIVTARRPERAAELRERYGVRTVDNAEAARTADTLILTVKPQDMAALLDELAPHVSADRLVRTAARARHARGPGDDQHPGAGRRGDECDLGGPARR
jgi:pyrroline-5-carboxylate reductase